MLKERNTNAEKIVVEKPKMPKVSVKHRKFCELYVDNGGQLVKACMEAGLGSRNCDKHLSRPEIKEYINTLLTTRNDPNGVTTNWVVRRLMNEATTFGEGTSHQARVSALKHLSEYTGGFDNNKQKTELTGAGGGAINLRAIEGFTDAQLEAYLIDN